MLLFLAKNNAGYEIACCFGVFGIIFVVGIMALVVTIVRRRQTNNGHIWANSARMLGLQLEPPNQAMLSDLDKIRNRIGADVQMQGNTTAQPMFGQFARCEVRVWIRQEKYTRPGMGVPSIIFHTCCSAKFIERPGLQFLIRRKNAAGSFINAISGGSFQVGYGDFDRLYQTEGSDPLQIQTVLAHRAGDGRAVAEQFVAAAGSSWSVGANGEQVVAEIKGMVLDTNQIADGLRIVTDLAKRFEAALR